VKRFIRSAALCVILASCSISDPDPKISQTAFTKGQKVCITVDAGNETKVGSSYDKTTGKVNFKWESGDQIAVTVDGSEPAVFTLYSGVGGSSAQFYGEMPEAGDTFDVQYPVEEPDLSEQDYSAGKLPHDEMFFKAEDCTLESDITLEAQYSALRLNLYGEKTIGKIIVTNYSTSDSYTLNCGSSGFKPGLHQADASPIMLVVPAGTYNFGVAVYDNKTTPEYVCGFDNTSSRNAFEAGKIKNMPVPPVYDGYTTLMPSKVGDIWWAPVNCGYSSDYDYGKLYQWGRKVGGGYYGYHSEEAQEFVTATFDADGQNKNPEDAKLYKIVFINTIPQPPYDWYTNRVGVGEEDPAKYQLQSWPVTDPAGTSGIGNPCPDGWVIPSRDMFTALIANKSSWTSAAVDGKAGRFFSGSHTYSANMPSVFLQTGGAVSVNYWPEESDTEPESSTKAATANDGEYRFCFRGEAGYYWSSSTAPDGLIAGFAYRMSFGHTDAAVKTYARNRTEAYSVRCVKVEPSPTSVTGGTLSNISNW